MRNQNALQRKRSASSYQKLQADLRNGPRHCFGMHDNCSAEFCTTVRERQNQETEMQDGTGNPDLQTEDAGSLSDVAADQVSNSCYNSDRLKLFIKHFSMLGNVYQDSDYTVMIAAMH